SRQYVDSRCVWYGKPLIESGTLGTKANVQVILPHKTQSYSESQDPPEESIPLCTLKHFPHAIEHTIEWARDAFEGLFVNGPQEAERFLKKKEIFLKKLQSEGSPATQRERLSRIYEIVLAGLKQKTIEHCVEKACYLFQDYFYNTIEQLLYNFPLDHITSSGQPFWSGPKRPPMSLEMNVEDEVVLLFLSAAANLFAFNLVLGGRG
ncbi:ubiquitin-activating enzyme E1 family protein, partial [Cardiosporidium cionae]